MLNENKKYFNKVPILSELSPKKDPVRIPLEFDVNNCIATKITPVNKIENT